MTTHNQKKGIIAALRDYFLTGILASMPILVTVYLVVWVMDLFDLILLSPFWGDIFHSLTVFGYTIPIRGLGLFIFIFLMIFIGLFARNFLGRYIFSIIQRIINRIPIIKTIYSLFTQVLHSFLSTKSTSFRQVGLIEYPIKDTWAIVFVTSTMKGEVSSSINGNKEDILSVFIPTTPNPTSGFLLMLPKSKVKILDMKADEAMKMIISAGVVSKND